MKGAIVLQKKLHELLDSCFASGTQTILEPIASELRDTQSTLPISSTDQYTKTLGLEWNSARDQFRFTVSELPPIETMT